MQIFIITMVLLIILIIVLIAFFISSAEPYHPEKEAGKAGEKYATSIFTKALYEDDHILTNLSFNYEDSKTELDNVIINKYGVFIIEVKTYIGKLYGSEDDYTWTKIKTTDAGNIYEKEVKNPIPEVRRQVYLLSKYLKQYNINVWIEGYAYFVNNNSAVDSEYILYDVEDVKNAVHRSNRNRLTKAQVNRIVEVLENCKGKSN